VGGRIQLQYHYEDPDDGESTDELFFRRLRPYIEGSLHKDWKARFQWDMGDGDFAVKGAFFAYSGFGGMELVVGNHDFPFSRELQTSFKYQQLVERTFVGDHNYGTPDKDLGIHLLGHTGAGMLTWRASFASASIDPSNSKLDFDTPINKDSDFNAGWIYGGRLDYHPFGELDFSQGNFDRDLKASVGVAAFGWSNDSDNNVSGDEDVDSVTVLELSGALRFMGVSVDAQYNTFDAELVESGVTDGIFQSSETTLENWAVEDGYMLVPSMFELVAGYQSQDADGYAETWDRMSFGLNWFIKEHDAKVQLTYRIGENKDGKQDNDLEELFLQAQYVF